MDPARLTFLGHSTVLIEVDSLRILTDPVLGAGLGPIRRQVPQVRPHLFDDLDAIFISHAHHDHLDIGSLRRVPGTPQILVPRGLGPMLRRAGFERLVEVDVGDDVEIDRVRVQVVKAEHDGRRPPLGPHAPALGCLIHGSHRIYFAGDTDLFDEMRFLDRPDVAFLPVWGWGPRLGPGHMDPRRAAQAAAILKPRLAVPIHWGTLYPLGMRRVIPGPLDEPGRAFLEAAKELAPEVEVRILEPGASIDLSA